MTKERTLSQQNNGKKFGIQEFTLFTVSSLLLIYSIPREYRMLHVATTTTSSSTTRVGEKTVQLSNVFNAISPSSSTSTQQYNNTSFHNNNDQNSFLRGQGATRCDTVNQTTSQRLNVSPKPVFDENSKLKIAWLMSFPNSGTSYTGQMIRHVTMTVTGSNYGVENLGVENVSIPIFTDQPSGPFYVDPELNPEYTYPTEYIFTKTHCGGNCERCEPRRYTETTYSFRHRCLSSKWRTYNNAIVKGIYKPDRVTKAVHLIRDPFDNVVSRFHLERKIGQGGQIGREYENTRDGFRAFCTNLIDEKYYAEEVKARWMSPYLDELTAGIPCRADFFRYVEWHNMAFVTTRDMQLDTYILHYHWYATRFEQTLNELLQFLKLKQKADPIPFQVGKTYRQFFTADEQTRMKEAIQFMASPMLWEQLEQYFEND